MLDLSISQEGVPISEQQPRPDTALEHPFPKGPLGQLGQFDLLTAVGLGAVHDPVGISLGPEPLDLPLDRELVALEVEVLVVEGSGFLHAAVDRVR